MKRCGALIYLGMGEVRSCHKKAVAEFDAGKLGGYPVCSEHAEQCHRLRVTALCPAVIARPVGVRKGNE